MDSELIVQALNYHGQELRRALDSVAPDIFENVDMRVVDYLQYHKRAKEFGFQERNQRQRLFKFFGRKARLLYTSLSSSSDVEVENHEEETYAVMPPFEMYMGVPWHERKKCFYEVMKKGDPLVGTIIAFRNCGYMIKLMCMDGGKCREICDLGIKCFCSAANALVRKTHNIFSSYRVKDIIRGAVLKEVMNPAVENPHVSMKTEHLAPQLQNKLKMGVITEDDLPTHYRLANEFKDKPYSEVLEGNLNFNNPTNIYQIGETLGLNVHRTESLFEHLYDVKYGKEEYACALRKLQSSKWAFSRIRDGVTQFKAGNHIEAYQCLNKALHIDPESVEGLVARGALFANNNNFSKAIEDFEKALEINPHHGNAQKYLSETLVADGKRCQEQGEIEEARKNYERAILINDNEEAKDALALLEKKFVSKETAATSAFPSSANSISSLDADGAATNLDAHTCQKLLFLLEDEKQKSYSKTSPVDLWNLQAAHKSSFHEKESFHWVCDGTIPSNSNSNSYEEVKYSQQDTTMKIKLENQYMGRNDSDLTTSSDAKNINEKSLKIEDDNTRGHGEVPVSLEERLKEFYKKVGEDDVLERKEASCKKSHKLTTKYVRDKSLPRGNNANKGVWTEKHPSFKPYHGRHSKTFPFSDHSNSSCKRIKNIAYQKGDHVLKSKYYKNVNSENSEWLSERMDTEDLSQKRDKPLMTEVHHKSYNQSSFHNLDPSLRTKEHYELPSRKSQFQGKSKYDRKCKGNICRKSPCACNIHIQSSRNHVLPPHHHGPTSSHKYHLPENKYHRNYDFNEFPSLSGKTKHSINRLNRLHNFGHYRKDRGLICRAPDPEKLRHYIKLKGPGKVPIASNIKPVGRKNTTENSALAAAMAAAQKIEAALKNSASTNESRNQEQTLHQMELFLEKLKSQKKAETFYGSKHFS